jgi:hypothetical protein
MGRYYQMSQWVRLDTNFFTHPKVLQLPNGAKLLYLAALTFAGGNGTDGAINQPALRIVLQTVNAKISDVKHLVNAGLFEVTPDGYQIHDYLKFNPPAVAVKEAKEKGKQRQQAFRDRRNGNNGHGGNDESLFETAPSNGHRNALREPLRNALNDALVTQPTCTYTNPDLLLCVKPLGDNDSYGGCVEDSGRAREKNIAPEIAQNQPIETAPAVADSPPAFHPFVMSDEEQAEAERRQRERLSPVMAQKAARMAAHAIQGPFVTQNTPDVASRLSQRFGAAIDARHKSAH